MPVYGWRVFVDDGVSLTQSRCRVEYEVDAELDEQASLPLLGNPQAFGLPVPRLSAHRHLGPLHKPAPKRS